MKTLFIAVIMTLAAISLSYAANDGLVKHEVIKDYVACFNEDDLDSFTQYAISKDTEAMSALFGRCFILKRGTIVYLQDFRVTGKVKLRMRGKTSTFWTVREAID